LVRCSVTKPATYQPITSLEAEQKVLGAILVRPDMKVLYMSGYTENAIVRHGVLETDIFFIQKPFRTKKLLEKIREILDESLRQP
jgi:FixJ family two-component response regulator